MEVKLEFPDHGAVTAILEDIQRVEAHMLRTEEWYYDAEGRMRLHQLQYELAELVIGCEVQLELNRCREPGCGVPRLQASVCYPGRVHHLDGDPDNNQADNLAMVCPHCHTHILLSRYTHRDVWQLRMQGLTYAEIGRMLGISRERVRQLCNKYRSSLKHAPIATEAYVESLVRLEQKLERRRKPRTGRKVRVTDRRTVRKRILAALAQERELLQKQVAGDAARVGRQPQSQMTDSGQVREAEK